MFLKEKKNAIENYKNVNGESVVSKIEITVYNFYVLRDFPLSNYMVSKKEYPYNVILESDLKRDYIPQNSLLRNKEGLREQTPNMLLPCFSKRGNLGEFVGYPTYHKSENQLVVYVYCKKCAWPFEFAFISSIALNNEKENSYNNYIYIDSIRRKNDEVKRPNLARLFFFSRVENAFFTDVF
ncbi:hypothetical protein BDC45DRAFT_535622 [Circinella umbellata]|nr:hypothetical protein BDC45DRAFT_535622 [Circinella umbellata]